MGSTSPIPSRRLRIAVLECDTPLDGTRSKYGDYGGVFTALLQAAASSISKENEKLNPSKRLPLGPPPDYGLDITKFDVEKEETYPNPEDVDAVLLTGSRNNAFDSKPWILKLVAYVQRLLHINASADGDADATPPSLSADQEESLPSAPRHQVRIIGVCFGHQIVGRALGTQCERSEQGWEASVLPLELTEKGREIFGTDTLSLHQMHRDVVPSLPKIPNPSSPGITLLASSPRCEIQGFYSPGLILTVQGHPEFNQEIVEELLNSRHAQGIFDDEMFKDAIGRVADRQDGVVVGKAFLKFVVRG
ncbi:MAG: NADPH-cytochrome P450 reductase [Chaenotheca gracillima]|nr:MAG: NADPH-cytochrome P450 reductase [Chaenotheca gracillima]